MGAATIVLLLLLLVAAWPAWPYSRAWGYYPSGAFAALLVVALILVFSGYLAAPEPPSGSP